MIIIADTKNIIMLSLLIRFVYDDESFEKCSLKTIIANTSIDDCLSRMNIESLHGKSISRGQQTQQYVGAP